MNCNLCADTGLLAIFEADGSVCPYEDAEQAQCSGYYCMRCNCPAGDTQLDVIPRYGAQPSVIAKPAAHTRGFRRAADVVDFRKRASGDKDDAGDYAPDLRQPGEEG